MEPKRQAAASATQQLNEAIAAKDAALAKKAEAEATVADLEAQYNSAVKWAAVSMPYAYIYMICLDQICTLRLRANASTPCLHYTVEHNETLAQY